MPYLPHYKDFGFRGFTGNLPGQPVLCPYLNLCALTSSTRCKYNFMKNHRSNFPCIVTPTSLLTFFVLYIITANNDNPKYEFKRLKYNNVRYISYIIYFITCGSTVGRNQQNRSTHNSTSNDVL